MAEPWQRVGPDGTEPWQRINTALNPASAEDWQNIDLEAATEVWQRIVAVPLPPAEWWQVRRIFP